MRLLINVDLLTYIGNYYYGKVRGDPDYVAAFDLNGDGIIDMRDIATFASLVGTGAYIQFGEGINWLVVGGAIAGGLGLGFALAKLL